MYFQNYLISMISSLGNSPNIQMLLDFNYTYFLLILPTSITSVQLSVNGRMSSRDSFCSTSVEQCLQ